MRSFLLAIFRRKWLVVGLLALSLAMGSGWAYWGPTYWRAKATLIADSGVDQAGGKALMALLNARDLQAKVLNLWGDALYGGTGADAFDQFQRALTVKDLGAALIEVRFDAPSQALAQQTLDAILREVRNRNVRVFTPELDGDILRAEALAATEKLNAFQHQTGIYNLAATKAELVAQIQAIETNIRTARSRAEASILKLERLRARLSQTPAKVALQTETGRSKAVEDATSRLFELQAKEAELLSKYRPESAFVQAVREEMARVKTLVGQMDRSASSRTIEGANPVWVALTQDIGKTEADQEDAVAMGQALGQQLAELNARLQDLTLVENHLAGLERNARLAQEKLDLADNVSKGALNNIGVVESAFAASSPAGLTPVQVLALAVMLGLSIALGLVGVLQAMSRNFADALQLERRLGLPVLTSIPKDL